MKETGPVQFISFSLMGRMECKIMCNEGVRLCKKTSLYHIKQREVLTIIYSSELNNSGIKCFVVFKDTGSVGKIKGLIAIVVYLVQENLRERERERENRETGERDRETERIAQEKK